MKQILCRQCFFSLFLTFQHFEVFNSQSDQIFGKLTIKHCEKSNENAIMCKEIARKVFNVEIVKKFHKILW